MFRDVVLMDESSEVIDLARGLGFSRVYFKGDIKKLGMNFTENYEEKRKLVENSRIKILLNPHLITRKDSLHFRSSGLDHVLCRFMRKNNISLGITMDKINNFIDIGRVRQNIRLCRKYHVRVLCFSFAADKYQLRNASDLISFLEVLGMTPGEAKIALSGI